ncbi:MAG: response regulator [Alphaproteobacteria bacterium]|nr:response regulator [Alphaproteobacteria bacterium]
MQNLNGQNTIKMLGYRYALAMVVTLIAFYFIDVAMHRMIISTSMQDQILTFLAFAGFLVLLTGAIFLPMARLIEEKINAADEALIQAREAAKAKDDFLATISHEIRSPMSGVLGMAELLLETRQTQSQTAYTRTIINSGESLLRIIEDILDFSKIEAGRLELDPAPVNMLDIVDEVCALYSGKAREKALELIVRYVPGTEQFVYADPVRIRQILGNLVNNAIKFTERGYIAITIEESWNAQTSPDIASLAFSVEDTGIGIPASAQTRIFDKFTQADTSTTRRYGGTGLGLSICKSLVTLMGGTIKVRSQQEKGSVFSFTVPFRRNRIEALSSLSVPQDMRNLKVLVIDDMAMIQTVVTEQLQAAGMRADSTARPSEALKMMRMAAQARDPYKMVIIDYLMPEMNGEMLALAINDEPELRNTCLVMLSAAGNPVLSEKLVDKGFMAFIAKPVRNQVLLETLAVAWSRFAKGTRDELIRSENVMAEKDSKKKEIAGHVDNVAVLLVEDSRVNQVFAQEILEEMGCRVVIVGNGQEAVEAVRLAPYDLVLMDCQMPVMDGFEATKQICTLREKGIVKADMPVIALTANAMKGDRQRCIDAGMDDYISKPVRRNDLRAKIFQWTGKARSKTDTDTHTVIAEDNANVIALSAHRKDAVETPEILDMDAVDKAKAILKDKYGKMVTLYIEDVEQYLEQIEKAIASHDVEAIVLPAHTIKSSSRRMGAIKLSGIAEDIEHKARDISRETFEGDLAPISVQVETLNNLFNETKSSLLQTA